MSKPAAEFTATKEFIGRYVVIDEDELNIVSLWTMASHLFSEGCPQPHTMPYLYITAPKGAGKTLLGQDVMGMLGRNYVSTVGITGPGLFRLVDAGQPTLGIDEIDALYHGAKDETLRMMLNAGYRRGGMVPRVINGEVQQFSPFCPKVFMGIDNGHLPDTVEDRSIRIQLKRATSEEMASVEPFYSYECEDEGGEINESLLKFAKANGLAIRDYKPEPIPGLRPRQWEIARTLCQVADAAGIEKMIRASITAIYKRNEAHSDSLETRILRAIKELFKDRAVDRLTTNEILAKLEQEEIQIPGNNGKGLGAKLAPYGAKPCTIRVPGGTAKGYNASTFQDAFSRYL